MCDALVTPLSSLFFTVAGIMPIWGEGGRRGGGGGHLSCHCLSSFVLHPKAHPFCIVSPSHSPLYHTVLYYKYAVADIHL